MKSKFILLGLAFLSMLGAARAASDSLTITVTSAASTAVSCNGLASSLAAPVAAGAFLCSIGVAPSGWTGTLSLSGANASSFAISGSGLYVGATALGAGSYAVTITATP